MRSPHLRSRKRFMAASPGIHGGEIAPGQIGGVLNTEVLVQLAVIILLAGSLAGLLPSTTDPPFRSQTPPAAAEPLAHPAHTPASDVAATATRGFRVPVAPAESVWVEVAGHGDPIVLVPGLAGSAFAFRHVRPLLHAAGFSTVVVEPLGTGRSSRPRGADYSLPAQAVRLGAVLDSLGTSDVVLVAHSMAASMALWLAWQRPALVRGVVALDGGAASAQGTASMRRALSFTPLLRLVGGRGLVRRELAAQLASASGDRGWVTDEVVDGYAAPVLADMSRSLGAYQAIARTREPAALAQRLHELRCPVLLLHGAFAGKSAGLSPAQVDSLRQQIPGLAVQVLDGVGHYVHEEQPRIVAAAVAQFARRVHAAALPRTARP
jgi:pimeloyl-ACP methyl ester carboxylesterase